ncbi:hypothetical protein GFL09_07110 [Pseudomonas stutzeri]|uniref:Uncharacterized protein n=1 Tax=Stutzerimonas stutzeri KOS6 TaxID=1218352 RepID=A0A061JNF4_STUST|nr:hypothetical protein [Stutzerimonas stutzeri]EWC40158.1 hypothetical protein B597_016410 [Stutzerimonas stutzeri KOS6]MBK3867464.1 hypothetical protein [Stutzerimonas stutzeri]
MKTVPDAYLGVWRRRLLTTTAGLRDETSEVYWLQTARLHADVRLPQPQPVPPPVSLETCSHAQQMALCEQAGFAGVTDVNGDICQWHRLIDFQPPGGPGDIGLMRFEDTDRLLENGLDGSYHEVWQRMPESDGVNWGLWLCAVDQPSRQACLLVAGDYFMFAADRPRPLAANGGGHLREQLAAVGPALRPQLLACELSFGRHRNGATPWQITHSTLPGRVGEALLPSYWRFADPASLPREDLRRLGRYAPADGWVSIALPTPTAPQEVPA